MAKCKVTFEPAGKTVEVDADARVNLLAIALSGGVEIENGCGGHGACGTCHVGSAGGTDPRLGLNPGLDAVFGTPDDVLGSLGVARSGADGRYEPDAQFGFAPQVTRRAANTSIGAMFATELFWDGRASSVFVDPQTGVVSIPSGGALESQAVGPIVSDVEMAHEERNWDQVVAKYPKLAGKSEGIAFCAAVLEQNPGMKLLDMRQMGKTFAPTLTFSPISISSAEVAMGRREWVRLAAGPCHPSRGLFILRS